MEMKELLKLLEIESTEDMCYAESFCALMETEEFIEEGLFFRLFADMSFETLDEIVNSYFEEIVSAVPDDNIDFYTFISSYKRNLRGMMRCFKKEDNIRAVIAELYRFREWYQEPENVSCTSLSDNSEFLSSVCEALVLARMERLSVGSYNFDFENAMNLEYDEYEEYADEGDSPEEYESMAEDDPKITLIDRDNPVIDGENYDDEDKGEWL